jgi:hypothetical protein
MPKKRVSYKTDKPDIVKTDILTALEYKYKGQRDITNIRTKGILIL